MNQVQRTVTIKEKKNLLNSTASSLRTYLFYEKIVIIRVEQSSQDCHKIKDWYLKKELLQTDNKKRQTA